MQQKPLKTIASAIRQYVLMVSVISFAIVFFLYVGLEYSNLISESNQLRTEYLNRQKATIKEEVTKAIKLIEHKRAIAYSETMDELRKVVHTGVENPGYTQNISAPISIAAIINSKPNCRDKNDLCVREVFRIPNIFLPELLSNSAIKTGKRKPLTPKEALKILNENGECHFLHLSISTDFPQENLIFLHNPKGSLFTFGLIFNWNRELKNIQNKILQELSDYRFGPKGEGYIFVNTWNGNPLITNGELSIGKPNIYNLVDPNGVKIIQKEEELARIPGGGYMEYSWRKLPMPGVDTTPVKKISFILGVMDWQWIVGAGIYLDEMEQLAKVSEENQRKTFFTSIFFFFMFLVISFSLTLIFARFLQKKITKNSESLQDFVTSFAESNEKVNLKKWHFDFVDFNTLAKHIGGIELSRRAMEDNFKRLIALYPNPTILQEGENTQFVNDAWIREVGYTKEEIPSVSHWFLLAYPNQEVRAKIAEQWYSFLKNDPLDGNTVVEVPVYCKDGASKLFEFRVIRVLDDKLMITLTDKTSQKKYEEELLNAKKKAEESDKLKSAFLANMSHEIRTPMNAIVGFSSLLQKPGLPESKKDKYIDFIRNSGNSLLNLINDIIDISKIESGQLKITYQETNINKLLSEILAIEREIFKRDEHSAVMLKLKCNQPLTMKVDPARLKQIITNLISNARKFTSSGSVEFGFNPVEETDTMVTFFCTDTGLGIPTERLSVIFERFRTYDFDSGERVTRGTGLGLSITQNLVELMGGTIRVESQVGVGSTFAFILPLNHLEPIRRTAFEHKDEKTSLQSITGKLILVCDDEAENFLFINEMLRPYKAEVIWAKNGKEGVKIVGIRKVDLIIMDLAMPVMDGVKAIKLIKASSPQIPIIAVTELVMQAEKIKCMNAGCEAFIDRPIDETELLGKIVQLL